MYFRVRLALALVLVRFIALVRAWLAPPREVIGSRAHLTVPCRPQSKPVDDQNKQLQARILIYVNARPERALAQVRFIVARSRALLSRPHQASERRGRKPRSAGSTVCRGSNSRCIAAVQTHLHVVTAGLAAWWCVDEVWAVFGLTSACTAPLTASALFSSVDRAAANKSAALSDWLLTDTRMLLATRSQLYLKSCQQAVVRYEPSSAQAS